MKSFGTRPHIMVVGKAAAEAELTLVQAIVDSAGFIIQNPELTICYDERGAKYELPKYVLSEPQIRFMTIERGRAFAEEGTVYPCKLVHHYDFVSYIHLI